MADETGTPPEEPTIEPTGDDTPPPEDDTADASLPCGDDEDPELFIGDEIMDPWDDKFQTDWPQNEVIA
jgi:hypothetical protein